MLDYYNVEDRDYAQNQMARHRALASRARGVDALLPAMGDEPGHMATRCCRCGVFMDVPVSLYVVDKMLCSLCRPKKKNNSRAIRVGADCKDCGRDLMLQLDPPAPYLEKNSCYACGGRLVWHEVDEPEESARG